VTTLLVGKTRNRGSIPDKDKLFFFSKSRDSSVGIATGYGLD
jgi:hypothetical protein